MEYKELRKKYKKFVYDSFSYKRIGQDLILEFKYIIKPDLSFIHKLVVRDIPHKLYANLNAPVVNNLIFNIGMAEIPSYWKTTCSKEIFVKASKLNSAQIEWWKKLYMNGMMQYFFENNIDYTPQDFLNITTIKTDKFKFEKATTLLDKTLVTIGGGKDSAVSLGLIEKSGKKFGTLVIEKATPAAHSIAESALSEHFVAERVLDLKKLTNLNAAGYLNGHVPYSATLYFISLLVGYIFGYSEILFSNESSSNEANVIFNGKEVNHQYSKTFGFENDFKEYNLTYLSAINLFSFLRPLNELQISKLFSKYLKYLPLIRSCNIGQKDGIWCGKCPKCLSTFILLYPFIGKDRLIKVFGKDLFEDATLKDLLFNLTDPKNVKPFECVGTREELQVALNMAIKEHKKEKLPVLLEIFKDSNLYDPEILGEKEKELLRSFGKNNLPKDYEELLKRNIYGK